MSVVQADVVDYVRRRGRGKVYTSKDLLHLGRRPAIDQALTRLVGTGKLQRLARGLYYYPRTNPRLGITVGPLADDIAAALARQTGSRIAPSGRWRQTNSGSPRRCPRDTSTSPMDDRERCKSATEYSS